ncbi:CHASE3 domain-containing protein [Ramlibacter tataouinensis]|uniref:CHASE3 domain-containing protein n=1 Tax=Ramlibacter tataouinensis TaxID=94132 RepID=UPI0022F40100|nr:CHASE3 domain-containing protein [Ramlibacter tataouinensis]WBY03968.1 CHASE3 domain-containing protein [Ramlibacter tataouinensis]
MVEHSKGLPATAISLLLAVLAACVLIGINEAGYNRSRAELDSMAGEVRARTAINRLLQLVVDAETGSRGFLLTGDARYLEPYNAAVADIGQGLETLQVAYAGAPEESVIIGQLTRNVQRKLAEMELSVNMRKQGKEDAWKFVLLSDIGKQQMDAIREQAGRLIQSTALRIDASQAQVRASLLYARIGIGVVTLAALLAFWLYLRQGAALKAAGERQQQVLQQERDLLERQVRERTATLAELATHLQQVREDERGHLARELHDELGALLTAAKLDVARLKSRLGGQPAEVGQRLQHLTDTLNSGIALKRRIIEDLRPSALANLGLTASLEILAREFSERSGIDVAASLEPVELDASDQLTVYRLVQESFTNMAKYAHAKHAQVSVHGYDNHVEVAVRDDGRGFDPAQARPSSHGLAGMRHRVEAAGGKLTVSTRPGNGTRVVAVLPRRAGA